MPLTRPVVLAIDQTGDGSWLRAGWPRRPQPTPLLRPKDGKIVEGRVYYDLYSILVQMGKAEPLTQD